jgi:hypothetical protein
MIGIARYLARYDSINGSDEGAAASSSLPLKTQAEFVTSYI